MSKHLILVLAILLLGFDTAISSCYSDRKEEIFMNVCPFCFRNLGTIKNHFPSCLKLVCPEGIDRTVFGYESLYGVSRVEIERWYVVEQKGIRAIEREAEIPFRVLKYLIRSYGILRSVADSIRTQNEKNKRLFLDKYGVENPFQIPAVIAKIQATRDAHAGYESARKTNMERYGVGNPFQIPKIAAEILEHRKTPEVMAVRSEKMKRVMANRTPEEWARIKGKAENTNLEKYGVQNPFQIPAVIAANKENVVAWSKRRSTCEMLGLWLPESKKTEFERYFCDVRKITRKNRKTLFSKWEGRCFYTGQKLVTNEEFSKMNPGLSHARNPMRPTIDHKISLIRGFKDGISPEVLGGIDNLCICSQRVNSQKNYRTMIEFTKEEIQNVQG